MKSSKPQLAEALAHAGVMVGRLAGEHEQLLDAPARGAVEQRRHLVGRVQVRPVRRERAVLAEALARPRERERDVAREGDAAAHPLDPTGAAAPARARRLQCCPRRWSAPASCVALALVAALVAAGCARDSEDRPDQRRKLVLDFQPNAVHAGIYLALERDFDGAEGVGLRVAGAVVLDRQRQAPARRARAVRDPRHPRPGPRPREGARRRRGHGARAAPARRGHRPAADRAAARPRGQARRA